MEISTTTPSILTMIMIPSLIGLMQMMTTMVCGTISKLIQMTILMMMTAKKMATSSQALIVQTMTMTETMLMQMMTDSIKQFGTEVT